MQNHCTLGCTSFEIFIYSVGPIYCTEETKEDLFTELSEVEDNCFSPTLPLITLLNIPFQALVIFWIDLSA